MYTSTNSPRRNSSIQLYFYNFHNAKSTRIKDILDKDM